MKTSCSYVPHDHLIDSGFGKYLPIAERMAWAITWSEENSAELRFDTASEISFQQVPMANGVLNTFAVVTAKVYLNGELASTAEGSKAYISLNLYGELEYDENFIDTASTKAKGRALANLGFSTGMDVQEQSILCDTPVKSEPSRVHNKTNVIVADPADNPVKSEPSGIKKESDITAQPVSEAVPVEEQAISEPEAVKPAEAETVSGTMAVKSAQLKKWASTEKTPTETDIAEALIFVCPWGRSTKGRTMEEVLHDENGAATLRKIAANGALSARAGGAEMQHYAKVLLAMENPE